MPMLEQYLDLQSKGSSTDVRMQQPRANHPTDRPPQLLPALEKPCVQPKGVELAMGPPNVPLGHQSPTSRPLRLMLSVALQAAVGLLGFLRCDDCRCFPDLHAHLDGLLVQWKQHQR